MCSFRKNPYHLTESHWKFLGRGERVLKAKHLKAKYEANLEFPRGWGTANQNNLLWGEYGYFLELQNKTV